MGINSSGFWFNTRALASRDPSVEFETFAMRLFDSLYNSAHWLTQNREEAEDLVQETYAKALKGFGSFHPGTNGSFASCVIHF